MEDVHAKAFMDPEDEVIFRKAIKAYEQFDLPKSFELFLGLYESLPGHKETVEKFLMVCIEVNQSKANEILAENPFYASDTPEKFLWEIEILEKCNHQSEAKRLLKRLLTSSPQRPAKCQARENTRPLDGRLP